VQGEVAVKVSERLLERLRKENLVPAGQDVEMLRTHASGSMRTNGAWSWYAIWGQKGPRESVGSQWPMASCLTAPRWELYTNQFGEVNIDPRDENGRLP
jgi:hypothetical protein